MYCRIRLQETNYQEYHNYRILDSSSFDRCLEIYKQYVEYKGFEDIVPIFREEFELPTRTSSVIMTAMNWLHSLLHIVSKVSIVYGRISLHGIIRIRS